MNQAKLIAMNKLNILLIIAMTLVSCAGREQGKKNNQKTDNMLNDSTNLYGWNRDFLKKHIEIIELKNGNSLIALVPAWQGRVMTSSADGDNGYSCGWINHKTVAMEELQPHMNAFGGEERLWLGPEGGQYSIYFKKGDEFIYDNWQTPAFIDSEPFETISINDTSASFARETEFENYSGAKFRIRIERQVVLLGEDEIRKHTGINTEGLKCVAYRSDNVLFNKGDNEWKKETGLLSVWMLGMFTPSPSVVIAIPFRQGDDKELGVPVNDNYFGSIPPDRLKISGGTIFFRADGKSRGKIGLPPLRVTGVMGSYDQENNLLTLLLCKLPEGRTDYVNSAWELQEHPYSGDAFNSYNDGPLADGSQMGPFYELETSSPALALKPGESYNHKQVTMHLTGNKALLDKVSKEVLGVGLQEIEAAFK